MQLCEASPRKIQAIWKASRVQQLIPNFGVRSLFVVKNPRKANPFRETLGLTRTEIDRYKFRITYDKTPNLYELVLRCIQADFHR